jgi:hypothetical protein
VFLQVDLNGHLAAFVIGYELDSGHGRRLLGCGSCFHSSSGSCPVPTSPSLTAAGLRRAIYSEKDMTELVRDLRFGMRMLAKSPVFAVTAASLLAVGISANTLMFSVVDALLLRPLPVAHPENLVRLVEVHPNNFVTWSLPYGFCDAVAAGRTDLAQVLCQGEADVTFSDGRSTERVRVHLVSPNFFPSLGVGATLGRVLTADDERTAAMNAVLSYSFWQRRFDRDPAVLGRSITLGGHALTVVGVSPEGFNGLTVETSPDIRVPAAVERSLIPLQPDMNPALPHRMFCEIFGRLRPGVPFARANREMDSLMNAYDQELNKLFPPAPGALTSRVTASHLCLESVARGVSTLREQFSRGLQLSMAGVALLLLMACANVAGLLLARSAVRAPEMGIRLAMGARPGAHRAPTPYRRLDPGTDRRRSRYSAHAGLPAPGRPRPADPARPRGRAAAACHTHRDRLARAGVRRGHHILYRRAVLTLASAALGPR